ENPESFKLGGVSQTITILFADIRGFTRISEHAPPEKIVNLLNRYFSAMTEIIFAHGGTLDKYLGDGLMALFGAPTATPDDASNALNAAVAMQRRMLGINRELHDEGFPEIGVGMGLHTGEVIVGYIGSERRSEYTAIGDTVNTSSRLESNAQGGEILVSDATAKAARSRYKLNPREPIMVKNRQQPVKLWEVDWQRASGSFEFFMSFIGKTKTLLGLNALQNLVSDSMAIDMGSASTIIAVRGRGVVVDEPSVVAVNKVSGEVIAVGDEAHKMQGREARDV